MLISGSGGSSGGSSAAAFSSLLFLPPRFSFDAARMLQRARPPEWSVAAALADCAGPRPGSLPTRVTSAAAARSLRSLEVPLMLCSDCDPFFMKALREISSSYAVLLRFTHKDDGTF